MSQYLSTLKYVIFYEEIVQSHEIIKFQLFVNPYKSHICIILLRKASDQCKVNSLNPSSHIKCHILQGLFLFLGSYGNLRSININHLFGIGRLKSNYTSQPFLRPNLSAKLLIFMMLNLVLQNNQSQILLMNKMSHLIWIYSVCPLIMV